MAAFTSGQRLSQRYLLDRCVGSGGMSQVWLAHDEVLGRPVAVKTIDGTKFDGPSADRASRLAAVRHEARTAASISHPHVAQVYDFGEAELPGADLADVDRAVPYLVMELIEGEDLGRRLASGPLPWRSAARMAGEVAGALAAAHAMGIVHGDIKPANVMLTPTGSKVVDFGISTTGIGDPARLPAGTPAYLAPEVFAGDEISPASDVYALGVLLYAALTGGAPFPGHGWDELAQAHRDGVPIAALAVDGLPDEIAALCARCLAASPESRPTSEAAARALRGVIRRPLPSIPAMVPTMTPAPTMSPAPTISRPLTGMRSQTISRPPTISRPQAISRPLTPALVASRPARPRWWRAPAAVAASAIMVTGLVLLAVAAFGARSGANPAAGRVAIPSTSNSVGQGPVEAAPAAPVEQNEPAAAAAPAQRAPAQVGSANHGNLDKRVNECLASVVEAFKNARGRAHPTVTPDCKQLRSE